PAVPLPALGTAETAAIATDSGAASAAELARGGAPEPETGALAVAPAPSTEPNAAREAPAEPSVMARRARRAFVPPDHAARRVHLDEAVRLLGGAVRLVDGAAPTRVEAVGAEAREGRGSVRIVYELEDGKEIVLEQTRLAGRTRAAAGDTAIAPGGDRLPHISWIDVDGFRLTLTGPVDPDSLRRLARRVR
ncbi:MAG TPA: hypothetical protein VNK43_05310, partial [Gemmatimonadales bacterium]|nr:hypothetical protein [Gemmatimonadales bacterium]